MKKLLLIGILFLSLQSIGQTLLDHVNPYYIPNGNPPEWFSRLKSEKVNVHEIEEDIEAYLLKKYGKEIDFLEEEEMEEQHIDEPFIFVYRHWRRNVERGIDSKGNVSVSRLTSKSSPSAGSLRMAATAAVGNWVPLGPTEVYRTSNDDATQKANPHQSNISRVESSKSNPSIIYAISQPGNVFKSIDKGLNWTLVTLNYGIGKSTEAIAVDPFDAKIVFIAGEAGVVHKTVDGGTSWAPHSTGLAGLTITELKIAPDNSNLIFAATNGGLYRSTDGGKTWGSPVVSSWAYDIKYKARSNDTIFAAFKNPSSGLTEFRVSYNKGVNFSLKFTSTGTLNGQSGARIGVTPADSKRVYMIDLCSGLTLFKSTNSGEAGSWVTAASSATEGHFEEGQGYYDLAIGVSPTNANHVITGTFMTYKSIDGGITFPTCISCEPFPGHADFQDISINGNDTYIASDGGIVYSSDFFSSTTNTITRSKGLTESDFWHLDQGWDKDVLIGGRYHNGDVLLNESYPGKALYLGGAESATGWILHGTANKVLCEGANILYPQTFSAPAGRFTYGKQPNHEINNDISELLIDPRYYNHHFVGNDNAIWESWDGGKSFIPLKTFNDKVRKMEISRSNPNILYAVVTGDANLYKYNSSTGWSTIQLPAGWNGNQVDLAVNPEDAENIWISNQDGNNGAILYQMVSGSTTWKNETPSTFFGDKKPHQILFAGGTNKGIYMMMHEDIFQNSVDIHRASIYYKNAAMTDWIDFSNGLPQGNVYIRRAVIFYRDSKLRLGTSSGIWETPLYENSKPLAQPSVDKKISQAGISDTFHFYDYSILKYAGATRQWHFAPAPLYISDSTALRPNVVFGSAGKYTVTLKVTDGLGNTSTKTITDMVEVIPEPVISIVTDSIAGKALNSITSKGYAYIEPLNTPCPNLTMMAWIKTNGIQNGYTGVFFTHDVIGGPGFGLQIKGNGSIGYEWKGDKYWYSSPDIILPDNVWTHVALVVTPTSGKVYMNGKIVLDIPESHSTALFTGPIFIGTDSETSDDRLFRGLIDEAAIYKRALAADELRAQMHLTKKPALETDLIAYVQFNEASDTIYNKVDKKRVNLVGIRSTSTAPVGGGISFIFPVTSGGVKTFNGTSTYPLGNTGLTLTFPSTGSFPNGNIVATRLNVLPDNIPTSLARVSSAHWIIHNYGTVSTFTALSGLQFLRVGQVQASESTTPSSINLYSRNAFAEGATWGTAVDAADIASQGTDGSVSFTTGNGVTQFTKQFIVGFKNPISSPAPTVSITAPLNNTTYTAPANVVINASATNTTQVDFYNGAILLSSDNISPFSYTWSSVAAGTYSITAKATGPGGVTTSTAISIGVTSVTPAPTVNITAPVNNTTYTAPANVVINASATNTTQVDFYNGAILLSSDNTSPFSYTWSSVAAGTYSITAKATGPGGVTTSTAISIAVTSVTPAPTVSITAPVNNTTYTAPASVVINASATNTTKVDFYNGAGLLSTDNTSPFSYTWSSLAAGTYSITAKATGPGGVTTSTAVSIIVTSGTPAPTVSITAPLNNAPYIAPASVVINASATNATKVDFYNGAGLLSTDNTSPFSYTWSSVAAGTYSITAKATGPGGVTTSAAVGIAVSSSVANINGPDCGRSNTSGTYSLNPSLLATGANYSWYYEGSYQSITPVSGQPGTVIMNYGNYFSAGRICANINYPSAPFKQVCKTVTICPSGRETSAEADENSQTIVIPNPFSEEFTLSPSQEIKSIRVINMEGKEVLNTTNLDKGFGKEWATGIYNVYIEFKNGKYVSQKVNKQK